VSSEKPRPPRNHASSRRRLGAAAAFLVCALQPNHTEARVPSSPQERARFVARVRLLEQDPLAANANAARQELRAWVIDVPDIRFKTCPTLLTDVVNDDYRYSREINVQVLLSGAVLTIENPGRARDDAAVYTAGVEGALRAYEVLVRSMPTGRLAALDDLIETRDRGELDQRVARLAGEHCPKSKAYLIAAPIGAAASMLLALLVVRWSGRRGTPAVVDPPGHIVTPKATTVRRIVLICVAYYAIVGIALHFLEPEYDPRFQFMSDYAWGAYGWLMTTTFFALAVAVLTIAFALRGVHHSSRSARLGFGLLVVAALFVSLAGIFRGFPLHDVASAVAIPGLALAVLFLAWSFRGARGWEVIYPATFAIAIAMSVALVSMVTDVGMPGLQQRAFFCLLLVWLSVVVLTLVRMAKREPSILRPGGASPR